MHMADALISPVVGGTMWAAAAGAIALCSGNLKRNLDDRKIPLMGVLGAFIFAAQMINFAIPGTGSSGHLGGGMILAILLGPAAGFITMASVLTVQALFFADGGLLALGSNILNLGAATCFVAYPLFFRPLAGHSPGRLRLLLACLLSSIVGLQLGSFGVVAEATLSGVVELPFAPFLLLMQPIHLAIGLVEGIVTAAVVSFIWNVRPKALDLDRRCEFSAHLCAKQVVIPLLAVSLVCGGLLSGFASPRPDGLEWSMAKVAAEQDRSKPAVSLVHQFSAQLQEWTALLPGYDFQYENPVRSNEAYGTSLSGVFGGLLTLLVVMLGGVLVRLWQRRVEAAKGI